MQFSRHHSQILTIILILSALLPGLLLFGNQEYVGFGDFGGERLDIAASRQVKDTPGPILPVAATSSEIRLLFFGDLMLDRHIGEKLVGKKISLLFDGLGVPGDEFWSGRDLISANLEGAVTDDGAHYSPVNAYDFAFSPERIAELKQYGFNFFSLANNHISDQGQRGLQETRKNLDGLGFNFSGDVDAAVSPESLASVELQGQTIALVGLSMVYHDFDLGQAKKLIGEARDGSDLVIVNIHWGTEYQHQFSRHQQSIGRALIDAGADIIIGHHPHVAQGMEIYQGKPIFYSLGNFIFDQYFSPDTQQGLAVGLSLRDGKISMVLLPLQAKNAALQLMAGKNKSEFLRYFEKWSSLDGQVKIESDGRIEENGD